MSMKKRTPLVFWRGENVVRKAPLGTLPEASRARPGGRGRARTGLPAAPAPARLPHPPRGRTRPAQLRVLLHSWERGPREPRSPSGQPYLDLAPHDTGATGWGAGDPVRGSLPHTTGDSDRSPPQVAPAPPRCAPRSRSLSALEES